MKLSEGDFNKCVSTLPSLQVETFTDTFLQVTISVIYGTYLFTKDVLIPPSSNMSG